MHGSRRRKSGDAAPSQGPYVGRLSSTLVALRYGGGKQAVVPSMCRQGGPDRMGRFYSVGLSRWVWRRFVTISDAGPCAHTRPAAPLVRCAWRIACRLPPPPADVPIN